MYNRRNFLKLTGATAVGGFILGGNLGVFGQTSERFPMPATVFSDKSTSLVQQTFEPLLKTKFTFSETDDISPVSMQLVEIIGKDDAKNSSSRVPTDGFTLIFEPDRKSSLKDKIYKVSHPEMGEFSMFISSVGKSGRRYQAVFSRVYF